jgi:hypothetical protein
LGGPSGAPNCFITKWYSEVHNMFFLLSFPGRMWNINDTRMAPKCVEDYTENFFKKLLRRKYIDFSRVTETKLERCLSTFDLTALGMYCTMNQKCGESWPSKNNIISSISEGQEKYLRELSITPVGYFTGAINNHSHAVSHRNYFAWRKWGISEEQEWFSQG